MKRIGCRLGRVGRNMEMVWEGCRGRGKKTWGEHASNDIELLGLEPEWTIDRDVGRDSIWGKLSVEEMDLFKINVNGDNDNWIRKVLKLEDKII